MSKLESPPEGPTLAEQGRLWQSFPATNWPSSFILPFPAMVRIADDVLDELHFGRGGHSYLAPSHYGKSTLIGHLRRVIPARFPNMVAVRLEFPVTSHPTQREFYGALLRAADPRVVLRHYLEDRRQQALSEYLALAAPNSPPFIVFLIDEIQNAGSERLEWLKYFMSMLDECGIRCAAFGFGNEGLTATVKKVRKEHQNHLLKRYFRETLSMPGVSDQMTFARILRIIDWRWRTPGHGWTISQFYFPRAFKAGWRIGREIHLAWRAIRLSALGSASSDLSRDSILQESVRIELGTDVIRDLLQYYLTQFSQFDDPNWAGTENRWIEAASVCDFTLGSS